MPTIAPWSTLCFSLGIGVFQASQYDPIQIPTSQTEEVFEGQNLGFASNTRSVVLFHICCSCPAVMSRIVLRACALYHAEESDPFASLWKNSIPQYFKSSVRVSLLR